MGKVVIGFEIRFEYNEFEDLQSSYEEQLTKAISIFNGSIAGIDKATKLKLPKIHSKGLKKETKEEKSSKAKELSKRDVFRRLGFTLLEEKLSKETINYPNQTRALNFLYNKLNGNFDLVRSKYLEIYQTNKLCDMFTVWFHFKSKGVDGSDGDLFQRRKINIEELKGK